MSNWKTVDEIRADELVVEITAAKRGREGRRVFAFCLFREFVKDGLPRRTAFLRPGDADTARQLIDAAVARIAEETP